ncbi:MAG TPA: hypothetical protein VFV81_05915 [Verrucomicrobiae bacterium]|nr:hypothetical protein [Verrucomicrobiae bacterium]
MNINQTAKHGTLRTVANLCVASCQKLAGQIEQARQNILGEFRQTLALPERLFQLALNEAEALAWQTDYPQLFFPNLAAEKVQSVAGWHARQKSLRPNLPALALSN